MPVRVNLGCGDGRPSGYRGLDILKRAGTDVICDLSISIPLAGDSVEHVRAQSFLEHIDQLEHLPGEVVDFRVSLSLVELADERVPVAG